MKIKTSEFIAWILAFVLFMILLITQTKTEKTRTITKEVETKSQQCLIDSHNLGVMFQIEEAQQNKINICTDLLMNKEYYNYNLDELNARIDDIEAENNVLMDLYSQFKY